MIVRAGIRDRIMVQLLGGNIRQASTIVFALGAALAGLVGAAASPIYSVDPGTGLLVPRAVVRRRRGRRPRAASGARCWAGCSSASCYSLTTLVYAPAANVIIYVCMALVLLLRPQGLLGESEVIRQ